LSETIQFYAPDRELMILWGVGVLIGLVPVLWMGVLFGRAGAIGAATVIAVTAAALWLSAGGWWLAILSPPLAFGALIGVIVWLVRARTLRSAVLTKVLKG